MNGFSNITQQGLKALAKTAGRNGWVSKNNVKDEIVTGQISMFHSMSRLCLHKSQGKELENITTGMDKPACLTFGVLLAGKLKFSLADKDYHLEAPSTFVNQATCFAFNLRHETRWQRHLLKDNDVKKLVLSIPYAWLQNCSFGDSLIDQTLGYLTNSHGQLFQWHAGQPISQFCEHLLLDDQSQRSAIEVEHQALNLLIKLLQSLNQQNFFSNLGFAQNILLKNVNNVSSLAVTIQNYIEQHILDAVIDQQPSLSAIAEQLGLSQSKLQRVFKQSFEVSIGEYIRHRRLEIAHNQLLEKQPIGVVAYQAGYKHSSNFSLAYKKHYGLTPGEVISQGKE